MTFIKPSIPKGTRDFSPIEMKRRYYIFDTIKEVFQVYGYSPIETPSLENLNTLMGKYGEEGDRLIFKILNSGDFLSNVSTDDKDYKKITNQISEKGLRYDLTVPFARYVVMHQNEIVLPFKRYQIQPVWRADRPQKGRYREFFQCDADIIGSNSLINEAELICIINDVFDKFKIDVEIKLNNRKILAAIAQLIGADDKIIDITVAIDKLDKIGLENVINELLAKGLTEIMVEKLKPILELEGDNKTKLLKLKELFFDIEIGQKGVEELEEIFDFLNMFNCKNNIEIDLTLARGLNYYTGAIIEVKAKNIQMGSISGGGRYDDLTGVFGLKDMSGVGISFGADRIYDVLNELCLFPNYLSSSTKVMFCNFGKKETNYCLPILYELRKNNINSEIYPDEAKLKKQMNYANQKNIEFVVIAGLDEIIENSLLVKNMHTGEQNKLKANELISFLLNNCKVSPRC